MNHFLFGVLMFIAWSVVWTFTVAHQLIICWLIAVMIDRLPAPQNPYGFYAWFFGVTQVLAANLTRGKMGVQATLAVSADRQGKEVQKP